MWTILDDNGEVIAITSQEGFASSAVYELNHWDDAGLTFRESTETDLEILCEGDTYAD